MCYKPVETAQMTYLLAHWPFRDVWIRIEHPGQYKMLGIKVLLVRMQDLSPCRLSLVQRIVIRRQLIWDVPGCNNCLRRRCIDEVVDCGLAPLIREFTQAADPGAQTEDEKHELHVAPASVNDADPQ